MTAQEKLAEEPRYKDNTSEWQSLAGNSIARQGVRNDQRKHHSINRSNSLLNQMSPQYDATALDTFLERVRRHTFAVSCMAFQDVWTIDLERLGQCCIHVVAPDGRLVPFCAFNLTDSAGNRLYRSKS